MTFEVLSNVYTIYCKSYSTVVLYVYRDHEGLGILAQTYPPKTSLIFTFWHFESIG